MTGFLVYGSSTAQGHGDMTHGGWAGRLQASLRTTPERKFHEVINYGFRAARTTEMLAELPDAIERFHRPRKSSGLTPARIFGIFQPASDSAYKDTSNTIEVVPPRLFKETLRKIGALCTEQMSAPPIFATIQPIVPIFANTSRLRGFNPEGRAEYNQYLREIANSEGYPLVDVERAFLDEIETNPDGRYLFADDGFHPSEYGHILTKDLLIPTVEKLLIDHPFNG